MAQELSQEFEKMGIEIRAPSEPTKMIYTMTFQPELMEKIKKCQEEVMNEKMNELAGEEIFGERKVIAPELIQQTKEAVDVIRNRFIAAQDRQRKYADPHRKDVEYEIGEAVLLKVSSWKGIARFGKKGKLNPRFNFNPDTKCIIENEPVDIESDLSYIEQLVSILDRKDKLLRNKTVPLVKVLWRNPKVEESMWELESDMFDKYPHLFA
ncbi:uncharacterized protein LOC135151485 [Daucus carota subsp. sativus]|uniref:uncharacterized protein LOC135151485 n=1 Tax=Daucus carota subsp. sativus TaxID=79200 RepID=UPI003083CC9C